MRNIKLVLVTVIMVMVCQKGFSQNAEIGLASYYDDKFEGRTTANGEVYQQKKMTAAHRTLPFNTKIRVTNLNNQRAVIVRVNDRGPFVQDRIVDLSKAAAIQLDFMAQGVTKVKVEVLLDQK